MAAKQHFRNGFTLIEILVALSILSIVLLSLFSSVSSCIYAIKGNAAYTRGLLIARNSMNELLSKNMRAPDMDREPAGNGEFKISRVTKRFEHPLLPSLVNANITTVTVFWQEGSKETSCSLSYVFPEK